VKTFAEVLSHEKVPYLVTIFFAALGWVVTYTVGRVDATPTVMYKTCYQTCKNQKTASVEIENISRDKVFNNLEIGFFAENKSDKYTRYWWEADAPAWKGQQQPASNGSTLSLTIAKLQPGWRITLGAAYEGPEAPTFRLISSDDTVRLVKPSPETFFVQHEFGVIFSMLGLYLVIIGLVLFDIS